MEPPNVEDSSAAPPAGLPVAPLDYAKPDAARRPLAHWLWLTSGVASVVAALYVYERSARRSPICVITYQSVCYVHMRSIATGLILYANESGGRYPDRLEDLLEAEDLNGPSDLVCFSSGDMPATGPTVHDVAINSSTGGHISYVYLGKGMKYPAPPDAVIAYESLSHHGNGMHMLFGDGKVFFVPAAQAQQILQQVNAGINPPTMPAGVGR